MKCDYLLPAVVSITAIETWLRNKTTIVTAMKNCTADLMGLMQLN